MHTILLVRMSSLGDIVHTFPVLTDIRRERPQSKIHWAVEEAYASDRGSLTQLSASTSRPSYR